MSCTRRFEDADESGAPLENLCCPESDRPATAAWPNRHELQPVSRQADLDAALMAGGTPVVAGPGLFVVSGEAVVHAVAGIIDAHGHAQIYAKDAAKIRAQDDARARVEGSVHVDAYDRAVVFATGRARVRASDRSEVIGDGMAQVTAVDDVDVVCRDGVTVEASDRVRVDATGAARVFARGDAVVRASEQSSVWACDHAVVWADAGVSVECEGDAVLIRRQFPQPGEGSGDERLSASDRRSTPTGVEPR